MQSRVRNTFSRVCAQIDRIFTPHFAVPANLTFGEAPSGGSGTITLSDGTLVPTLSRRDHRHGMPATPDRFLDAFSQFAWYLTDFIVAGSGGDDGWDSYSDISTGLILDEPKTTQMVDPGDYAHGTAAMSGNTAGRAGLYLNNQAIASNETTRRQYTPARFQQFQVKARLTLTSGGTFQDLTDYANGGIVVLGGIHTTVNKDLTTIDDGIYFYLNLPANASGIETWSARCTANGLTTEVGTSIVIPYVPISGRQRASHQIFEIDYDGVAATFYITNPDSGKQLVATITTRIPDQKLSGWGGFIHATANSPQRGWNQLALGYLRYQGRR